MLPALALSSLSLVGTVLALGACFLGSLTAAPEGPQAKGDIDILGGLSFTLHVVPRTSDSGAAMPVTPAQVDQAMQVAKKRLKSMGTTAFTIARQADNGILLQVPGAKQEASPRIRAALETVGSLELREVESLANALMNPMANPLKIDEVRIISPQAKQSLHPTSFFHTPTMLVAATTTATASTF